MPALAGVATTLTPDRQQVGQRREGEISNQTGNLDNGRLRTCSRPRRKRIRDRGHFSPGEGRVTRRTGSGVVTERRKGEPGGEVRSEDAGKERASGRSKIANCPPSGIQAKR